MYHHTYGDDDMDLSGFVEKPGLSTENEGLPGFFLHDDRSGEYQAATANHQSSSSSAIPINGGRTNQQSNLSASPDSTSSSYPVNTMPEIPAFRSFITGPPNQAMGGNSIPRYATGGARAHYPGQYVGSLPQDPYPTPILHAGVLGRPSPLIGPQHDHLSMVYGQSCPEASGFPAQLLSGLKHHPGHSPMLYPTGQPNMYASSEILSHTTQQQQQGATGLSASLFQFRTGQPSSTEQIVEKQKKRKESHNAVERRRRDHINEMIHQLGLLVDEGDGESARLNKGEILQKAVERIRMLERIAEIQATHLGVVDPTFTLPEITIELARGQDDEE